MSVIPRQELLRPRRDGRPSAVEPPLDVVTRVHDTLRTRGYPALQDVRCELASGTLVLWGVVPSYHLKQVAQHAALAAAAGRSIDNRLEVASAPLPEG